ncbi:MAG: sugar transferase [Segetibacter sp.]
MAKAPEYKKLLSIKPGITSLGQIKYGYAENVDQMIERMQLDLLYLDNQNLSVDMGIIIETVSVMAQGKGK